jgi:hypothetical protein
MNKALGWALGTLTTLALAAPATAQDYRRDRYDDRYRYDDGRYDRDSRAGYARSVTFSAGYNRGFEDGAREGEKDAHGRRAFGFWNDGRYRDADHGYRSSFGPKVEFQRGFQRGYAEGYRRAYAELRPGYPQSGYDDYDRDGRIIYESPRRY